jgi:hypothetical protein
VHANPKNVHQLIFPPENTQQQLFNEIHQPDDDPLVVEFFTGVQAEMMAFGHFHYTFERHLFGIHLVNVSPASFSNYTSDRRARYTVFKWKEKWELERKYIEYDIHQEYYALLNSTIPNREQRAKFFKQEHPKG